ncbi:MAG: DUF4404 family protein [Gammaproteobacteria bacterium]|nr:DUF4404 family protein [Gammaproteobacteria bacterium]
MSQESLRESLDALRAEVDKLESGDREARRRLDALIADIETRLAAPANAEQHETLVENIRDTITEFEVSHPRTTGILNHIMVTLANMGI